jgi:predicted DNA-binding transcriptional regulator AlpA
VRIDLTSLWLTKKEVAAMLKVSLRQVEKLTAAGMFVYPRYIGVSPRWSAIEVETWLHSLPQHPAAQA